MKNVLGTAFLLLISTQAFGQLYTGDWFDTQMEPSFRAEYRRRIKEIMSSFNACLRNCPQPPPCPPGVTCSTVLRDNCKCDPQNPCDKYELCQCACSGAKRNAFDQLDKEAQKHMADKAERDRLQRIDELNEIKKQQVIDIKKEKHGEPEEEEKENERDRKLQEETEGNAIEEQKSLEAARVKRQDDLKREQQRLEKIKAAQAQNAASQQALNEQMVTYGTFLFTQDWPGAPSYLDGKGSSLDFKGGLGAILPPMVVNYENSSGGGYSKIESPLAFTFQANLPFWIHRNNYFGLGGGAGGTLGWMSFTGMHSGYANYNFNGKLLFGFRRLKLLYTYEHQYHSFNYTYNSAENDAAIGVTNPNTTIGKGEAKFGLDRQGLGLWIDVSGKDSEEESFILLTNYWDKPNWLSGGKSMISHKLHLRAYLDFIVEYGHNYFVTGEQKYNWDDANDLNSTYFTCMIGKTFNLTYNVKRKSK